MSHVPLSNALASDSKTSFPEPANVAVDARLCEACFYRNECGTEGNLTGRKKPAVQRAARPEQLASSQERRTPKTTSTGSHSADDEAEGQACLTDPGSKPDSR